MKMIIVKTSLLVVTTMMLSAFAQAAQAAQSQQPAASYYDFATAVEENNQAYHELRASLGGDKIALAELLKAENAWQAYRDSQCSFEKHQSNERETPYVYSPCGAALTKQRTIYLRNLRGQ